MRTIAIVMLVALARAGSATVVVSADSAGETPAALAQRYDAATVHARGIIGASTRIAVVAESDVSVADLADFRATNGFPGVSVDRVAVAGSVPTADPTMTVLLASRLSALTFHAQSLFGVKGKDPLTRLRVSSRARRSRRAPEP